MHKQVASRRSGGMPPGIFCILDFRLLLKYYCRVEFSATVSAKATHKALLSLHYNMHDYIVMRYGIT